PQYIIQFRVTLQVLLQAYHNHLILYLWQLYVSFLCSLIFLSLLLFIKKNPISFLRIIKILTKRLQTINTCFSSVKIKVLIKKEPLIMSIQIFILGKLMEKNSYPYLLKKQLSEPIQIGRASCRERV